MQHMPHLPSGAEALGDDGLVAGRVDLTRQCLDAQGAALQECLSHTTKEGRVWEEKTVW